MVKQKKRQFHGMTRPGQSGAMAEALEGRLLLSASYSFSSPVTYNIGTSASASVPNISQDGVATGDFNGDGKADLAVVHTADNTVNILINNGNGTFKPAVKYQLSSTNTVWVTVADVNGDGKEDLIVEGSQGSNGLISVLLGNGDGTFKSPATYVTGGVSRGGVAVADFNGDGKPDLAVAQFAALDSSHSAVDILINNGNGTFKPYTAVPVAPAARAVTAGDFNGDGKIDLAVADGLGSNNVLDPTYPAGVTLLLGNGNGTFTPGGQYNAVTTPDAGDDGKGGGDTVNPEAIKAADLNGDGHLDLIESLYDHNIDIFLNNGNGTFKPAVGYTTGEYPRSVVVSDFNHDGKQDLVVDNIGNEGAAGGPETGSIVVLLGNGNGTFGLPTTYTPFNYPGFITRGDFNGDGLPDIAVTRLFDGHSVNIMFDGLTVSTLPPTVTAVSPSSGPSTGGTAVTITGTNFTGATSVRFGGVAAASFTVNSPTQITATTTAESAATVNVIVSNTAGTSVAGSADHFTFTAPATPAAPFVESPGSSAQPGPVITTLIPTFTWKSVSNVTGYLINIGDLTLNKGYSYTVGASVTSYTIASGILTPGDKYVWNVRGLNGSISGPASVYLYFQTPGVATLSAPTVLGPGTTAAPGPVLTTLTPTLTWKAVTSPISGYEIHLFDETNGKYLVYDVGASTTSYTVAAGALTPGDKFVWNLRVISGGVTGPESAYLNFQLPPASSLPAPLIVGPGSSTSPGLTLTTLTPTLSWKAVSVAVTGYQINLYDETSNKLTIIQVGASVTSETLLAGVLQAGQQYIWNVRVLDGTVTGPESGYLYFHT